MIIPFAYGRGRVIIRNYSGGLPAVGRGLLTFLRAGLDVDGCDVSPDMLAQCRQTAEREGLQPHLYQQALHELDLPRLYQTIVVCGAFGLGVTPRQDLLALRRIYQHLNPGGLLLLDNESPYADASEWQLWLNEGRDHLPESWPDQIGKAPPADGSDYELYHRYVAFDPIEQHAVHQMRTLLWRAGQVVAEDVYTLTANIYFRNELRQMLESVGFKIEAIQGDYTQAEASSTDPARFGPVGPRAAALRAPAADYNRRGGTGVPADEVLAEVDRLLA